MEIAVVVDDEVGAPAKCQFVSGRQGTLFADELDDEFVGVILGSYPGVGLIAHDERSRRHDSVASSPRIVAGGHATTPLSRSGPSW